MFPKLLFEINYSLLFDVDFARRENLITQCFSKENYHSRVGGE
jgi:hypothetical protein